MNRIPFDVKELEPIGTMASMIPVAPPIPKLNTPISTLENYDLLINGEKPLWITNNNEMILLNPSCVPDSWARGMVSNGKMNPPHTLGGKDMFGVEWVFEPDIMGSMVMPGNPKVKDLENWEDNIEFPDIESWDWERAAEEASDLLSDGRIIKIAHMNGMFERLISFVGMEEALIAMIDEDYQEAVHRLFDRLCILYDGMFEKYKKFFNAKEIWFHDDWGSQKAPFFSNSTVEEMLLPYIKRVCDSAHKYGIRVDFHSCGKVEDLVPIMIEAGCDGWDGQVINDKLAVAKKYGDKILINVVPEVAPGASDEEVIAAITGVLKDFEGTRYYFGRAYGMHPRINELSYEVSRKYLNQ